MSKQPLGKLLVVLILLALLYSACGQAATPVEGPVEQQPPPPPPGECPSQRSSYVLEPDYPVQVNTTEGDPLNIRAEPGFSSPEIFELPDGYSAHLLEGPVERDCHLWWRIETVEQGGSRIGWAVEAAEEINTLVPVPLLTVQEDEVWLNGEPIHGGRIPVYPGDKIVTGLSGKAVVAWDVVSFTQLFALTEIEMRGEDLEDTHSYIKSPGLASPLAWHWFGHTFGQWVGETITKIGGELQKNMRVGLTHEREVLADGTEFGILVPEDDTMVVVTVTEGSVTAVTMVNGQRTEATVSAGQHAALVDGVPPRVVPIEEPIQPAFTEAPPVGPIVLYDFVQDAPSAQWSSDTSSNLPFASELFGDGTVNWYTGNLENGRFVENALITQPNMNEYGWITGLYDNTTGIVIQLGDYLSVEPGFIEIAEGGEVTFMVLYSPAERCFYAEEFPRELFSSQESYDGEIPEIRVDLSDLAGQSGCYKLYVGSGASFEQDQPVWVTARLLRPR